MNVRPAVVRSRSDIADHIARNPVFRGEAIQKPTAAGCGTNGSDLRFCKLTIRAARPSARIGRAVAHHVGYVFAPKHPPQISPAVVLPITVAMRDLMFKGRSRANKRLTHKLVDLRHSPAVRSHQIYMGIAVIHGRLENAPRISATTFGAAHHPPNVRDSIVGRGSDSAPLFNLVSHAVDYSKRSRRKPTITECWA